MRERQQKRPPDASVLAAWQKRNERDCCQVPNSLARFNVNYGA
jgi:hypothetical protein